MSRSPKVLILVPMLFLVLPIATIACPPDCGPCRYWTGYSCDLIGNCDGLGDCSGCERCINCWCEDFDTYCQYWHDDCWYCYNGVCLNSCTANQVCINGQCVTVTLTVTASKPDPTLCEDVTFTATTNPPGYASQVQWSAPGGEPSSGGPSSTFTTHWPCIGGKTVTATLGSCSRSGGVNVVLPEGCTTGSQSASLEASVLSTEVTCPEGVCGKTALLAFPDPSVSAKYEGCAWVFQVTANAYLESGVCPGNYINTTGPEDVNGLTYCGVVYRFVVRNGCVRNADGTINSNSECELEHEAKHAEIFEAEFAGRSSWLASQPSMSAMSINCSDPSTVTCQAAESARQGAISSDVTQACLEAWQVAQDETLPEAAAQVCLWSIANDICSYAYQNGWPNCPYCPE